MRNLISIFSKRPFITPKRLKTHRPRTMTTTNASAGSKAPAQKERGSNEKKELKILMIHGFTQSGPLFHAKTRALEKLLTKVLSPFSISPSLIYPTAPIRLQPKDIPGYQPPTNDDDTDDHQPDSWAWWRKDEATNRYRDFDKGMLSLSQDITRAGGVDAVIGFSQGGAAAGVLAAALEQSRPLPKDDGDALWAHRLREANGGKGLKFAVSYSGFYALPENLAWLYEPKIVTPTLHFIGSLDTVVDESRSRALVDRCEEPVVVVHPGGHYVPVSRDWVMPLAGFIKNHAGDNHVRAEL